LIVVTVGMGASGGGFVAMAAPYCRSARCSCATALPAFGGCAARSSLRLGQRIWQQLRDEMLGRGLSLKEFHGLALDLGGLPLDVLRPALLAS
jgi:hypothetical protein